MAPRGGDNQKEKRIGVGDLVTLTGLSRVVEGELRRDVHRWVDDMGPLPGEDFTVRLGERGLVLGVERIGGREWHRVLFPQGIGLVESMWLVPA